MDMQSRANLRSMALHREVAKKLRSNSDFWKIPNNNLNKWKKINGNLSSALEEWKNLITKKTRNQILEILEGDSEYSYRLRSSSPFTGILSEDERNTIFQKFSQL